MNTTTMKMIEELKPTWYSNMTLKSTDKHHGYHKYTYCGLTIYENLENTHFNATRVMEQVMLKDDECSGSAASQRINRLMTSKFWCRAKDNHPDWFVKRAGEGASKYKFGGQYIQWHLFTQFINDACPGASMYLECGMEIPIDKSGYLYWCKPEKKEKCLGTDTIKVGRTWNWQQRSKAYGKNTEEYRIIHTNDMYTYEALMQKAVEQILTHDTSKGDEYYILKDDDEDKWDKMEDIFDTLLAMHDSEALIAKYTRDREDEEDEERIKHLDFLITSHKQDIANYKDDLENFA